MASILDGQPLCHGCQTLTFVSLRDGFTHPMVYSEIVISGKTCPLCRMIVCTMGKLQNNNACHEIEKRYDSEIERLVHLPAVYRHQIHWPGLFPLLEQLIKPYHINWRTEEYHSDGLDHEVRKGNFEGGETIQVTAAKDSIYRATGLVPLDKIMPAPSRQNFDLLRDWLKCCLSTHEPCRVGNKCTDENAILPTRVVDVGSSRENDFRPRLLQTKGKVGAYMTLSHRWGSTESQLRTESSTLERFQRELPMKLMPQTFRDAIAVTRQLDIRYLWIDSLCIVQDDPVDWKRESLKMGDIFESCICTIAATDALNEDGGDCGLFLSRDADPLAIDLCLPYDKTPLNELSLKVFRRDDQVFVWKYKWLAQPDSSTEAAGLIQKRASICLRPRIVSLTARMRRSIWYNRGWVLQERVLSPRIVYFTKDKIFWSCFKMTREEENSDPTSPHRICAFSPHVREHESVLGRWKDISDYIRCNLTFGKDRLAAIDGITRQFKDYYSIKIYAGIFHDETGESLLWCTNKKPLQNFSDFHAPSWSWASLAGCVSFSLQPPPKSEYRCLIRDLVYETTNVCPLRTPQGACGDTCISGSVSFISPIGKLKRSILVKDIKIEGFEHDPINEDTIMTPLLGSAVKLNLCIPRVDEDWKMLPERRLLFVPDHTELLICDYGYYLGFFIPDVDRPCKANNSILCAGIKEWGGDMQTGNSEIDFIGLEEIEQRPGLYHRVGRGRIICNGWLSICEEKDIKIV